MGFARRDDGVAGEPASTVTGQVARWCDAALDPLPVSHPHGHARDLTGAQVSDDPDLAAAKLAGAKVDMPAVVYELRAAYSYHSVGEGARRSLAPDLIRLVGPTDIATMSWERT